jgi:AAA family ATP:ADP antiporter
MSPGQPGRLANSLLLRSVSLSANFFLIILAYYQVKVASRSLFLEYGRADQLPLVWISSGLTLLLLMPLYQRLLSRVPRLRVVLGTCLLFSGLLLGFRLLFIEAGFGVSFGFYLLVDIFSVILVEQFWSLTNSLYRTHAGRKWYGLVGSGGILGGLLGGAAAAALLKFTPVTTEGLLLVSAGLVLLIFGMTLTLARLGFYPQLDLATPKAPEPPSGRSSPRYLWMITLLLLLSQLSAPIVEYQLMSLVQLQFTEKEARSVFISLLYLYLGSTALTVNLLFTPLIQRRLGVIAGLLTQPLLLGLAAYGFMINASLLMVQLLKIADRGLSYSINRASKELLYVPLLPELIYRAKAWIDMLGYRLFKLISSFLILLFTQWKGVGLTLPQFSWLILLICLVWCGVILRLRREYRLRLQAEQGNLRDNKRPA